MKPYYLKFADEAQAIAALSMFRTTEPVYETQETGEFLQEWVYRYTTAELTSEFFSLWELDELQARIAAERQYSDDLDNPDDIQSVEFVRLETMPVTKSVQVGERGVWITASLTHALDVVGVIAKTDAEGNAVTLDGFHVNLMIDVLPTELEQYIITPATPSRVFAGV